nr:glycosyltransferase [Halogeometricum sp. CBA1124]
MTRTSSTDDPLVTVIITTYNRPEYLRSAVQTVSEQRYAPIELVVVDDCSEVPASDVLADAAPDVRDFEIVRHDENRGANAARNTGARRRRARTSPSSTTTTGGRRRNSRNRSHGSATPTTTSDSSTSGGRGR